MEAALAHDAGLAVQLFEAHVDRTATILMDHADPAPASSSGNSAEKTR